MKEIVIVHFRSAMDYPPVYNLAKYLASRNVRVTLITGKRNESSMVLERFGVQVKEVSMGSRSFFIRNSGYLFFYLLSLFFLIRHRKSSIMYFESISSIPVFLFFFLFPFSKRKLLIHFHEFFDLAEMRKQSYLERLGRRVEKGLFEKASWISHTNEDRLSRFSIEFPGVSSEKLYLMPNYPPESWVSYKPPKVLGEDVTLRLVYIGSVSFQGLYLKEFVEWLISLDGKVICDVYSKNMNEDILNYFKTLRLPIISFKGSLLYDEIPKVLANYDVGVILYNGKGSSNVIYSAPNKLFEYAACGLDVWYSDKLISSHSYQTLDHFPKIIKVNFEDLSSFDYSAAFDKRGLSFNEIKFTMEKVYDKVHIII